MCVCRNQGTAHLDPEERAARNCCLPGYDTRQWASEQLVQIHMGAPPRYDLEGKRGDWMTPFEDIEAHGCPGGVYRTPFMESINKYRRRRDGNGGRIENFELTTCDIPLVHEAIAYLETEEELCYAAQREAAEAARSED